MRRRHADGAHPPAVPDRPPARRAGLPRLAGRGVMLVALAALAAVLTQEVWTPRLDGSQATPHPAAGRLDLDADAVPSASECLQRPRITTAGAGVRTQPYKLDDLEDNTTVDLRPAVFHAVMDKTRPRGEQNNYPVLVGTNRPVGVCLVGGVVLGQQSKALTWEQVKHGAGKHDGGGNDGDGVRVESADWALLAGTQVSNTIDAVGVGRGNAIIRDVYAEYIRDDCVEADSLSEVVIWDSLLDGCYMGVSQRPGKGSALRRAEPDPTKRVILDHVLLRLGSEHPGGHSNLFKWSPAANQLVLRDSVLMAEMESVDGTRSMMFPEGTEAHNVTLVWTGPGPYPGGLVPGVTVTRDRSVWDRAKADWLDRHGCAAFSQCDPARLVDPVPPGRPAGG